jgi:hypothetical protein
MSRLFAVSIFASILVTPLAALADGPMLMVGPAGDDRAYSIAELNALGAMDMATTTIWTQGVQNFRGVPLSRLLDDAGITEGSVTATAINEYAIDIPLDEIDETYPIVAFHIDGAPISVRDKGPFWIVYPFDAAARWRTEVIFSRSIWQLDRLQPGE